MWCKWCRDKVPAKRSATSGATCCARCSRQLHAADSTSARLAAAAQQGLDLTAPSAAQHSYDDWELDQRVRRLQAKLDTWQRRDDARSAAPPPAFARPGAPRRRDRLNRPHGERRSRRRRKKSPAKRSSLLAWVVLSFGLMAFACGTALLVCSGLEQRDDLWDLGMPITIGGQVGLLLGLVLQLERIWQNSRDATHRLQRVDAQLHYIERAASQWNATPSTAAGTFYSHMAADASPHILLADLQGQLDFLAAEIARR